MSQETAFRDLGVIDNIDMWQKLNESAVALPLPKYVSPLSKRDKKLSAKYIVSVDHSLAKVPLVNPSNEPQVIRQQTDKNVELISTIAMELRSRTNDSIMTDTRAQETCSPQELVSNLASKFNGQDGIASKSIKKMINNCLDSNDTSSSQRLFAPIVANLVEKT